MEFTFSSTMLPARKTYSIALHDEDGDDVDFDEVVQAINYSTKCAYADHGRSAEFRIDVDSLGQDLSFEWLAIQFNECLAHNATEENFRRFLCAMAAALQQDADNNEAAALYVAATAASVPDDQLQSMISESEYHVESGEDAWAAMGRHIGWDNCPSEFEDYIDWDQYGRDYATSSVEINGTLYAVLINE